MPKEYRTIEEVAGLIMLVRGVQGVTYGKMGKAELVNGGRRRCKVLEINGGSTMVQLYETSTGINLDSSKVRFLGHAMELDVSEGILSHMFDGVGKPVDGGPDILPEKHMDINSLPMNPTARSYPEEFIQTGISAIDGLNTLVHGQKLPIFSASGLSHTNLAAQITYQVKVCDIDGSFAAVSAAMSTTSEETNFSMESFHEIGVIDRGAMFINLANDPVVERVATPRMAPTVAEYLAFEKNVHVLVILTDITNYTDFLRGISAARKEVPNHRSYPGYMHTDLASPYGRAGCRESKNGSTIMIPILTMPKDDKTHPVPNLTSYITEGQIILSRELCHKNVTPPIDVLPSLFHLKDKGIGEDKTRVNHADVMDQLFAAYARDRNVKELMIILGETALTNMDKLYAKSADEFEKEYVSQGYYADRDIKETMGTGWELLRILPKSELKRIKDKFLDLYYEAR